MPSPRGTNHAQLFIDSPIAAYDGRYGIVILPDYWKENQGVGYDELGARKIANTLKLRANGITAITSPRGTNGGGNIGGGLSCGRRQLSGRLI